MEPIFSFFESLNPPTIPNKSNAEKALDVFLSTRIEAVTPKQLDDLNDILSKDPFNPACLTASQMNEIFLKNKEAITKLLDLSKIQTDPDFSLYISFEKIETAIQLLLNRSKKLVQSTTKFSEKELERSRAKAGILLKKANNLEAWSKVTDALYQTIYENKNQSRKIKELLSAKSFDEYVAKIENLLNLRRNIQPRKIEPPHPSPK